MTLLNFAIDDLGEKEERALLQAVNLYLQNSTNFNASSSNIADIIIDDAKATNGNSGTTMTIRVTTFTDAGATEVAEQLHFLQTSEQARLQVAVDFHRIYDGDVEPGRLPAAGSFEFDVNDPSAGAFGGVASTAAPGTQGFVNRDANDQWTLVDIIGTVLGVAGLLMGLLAFKCVRHRLRILCCIRKKNTDDGWRVSSPDTTAMKENPLHEFNASHHSVRPNQSAELTQMMSSQSQLMMMQTAIMSEVLRQSNNSPRDTDATENGVVENL